MPQLRAVLEKGFTLFQVVIVLVVIGVLTTLVLVKMGGAKEEAYVAAMKNDLRNYATAEEMYFHATSDGYGSPDRVEARQGFTYSDDVTPDTSSYSRNHWYLRVEHAGTDIKCELFFSPADGDPNPPNRIICPGDPLLMPVDVDLATSGIQFTLNTDDATYSAKVRQADGAVLDFEVLVRHPNDSTSLLCRKSGPREVLCSGDIPVEQEGEYTIMGLGSIGGASPSGTGALTARDSISYEVINLPPSASFSFSPTVPQTDESVAFDGSGSSDADGSVASYSWDFGDGETVTGPTPFHSYAQDGEYSVRLIVTDNLGKQDSTVHTVGVANRSPTVDFTFSPTEPQTDETIRLDGSPSEDPDGTIPDYRWSFDGGTATAWGPFTTETSFGTDGDHTLALQVRDDDGTVSDWVEHTVTVSNQAPIASFTFSPSSPQTDETISIDGSESSDADGSVVDYRSRFDGGTASAWSTSATTSTSFSSGGNHTLELQVRDDDGAVSGWASQIVTVQNQPPTADFTFSPSNPTVGESVTFDGGPSFDSDGAIRDWNWDFDDGSSASGELVSHVFDTSGPHDVRLVVVDDDNDSAADTKTVTVEEVVYACDVNKTVVSQPGNTSLRGNSYVALPDGEYDGRDVQIKATASETCGGNSFCSNWSPDVSGSSGAHSWSTTEAQGSSCGWGPSQSGPGDPSGASIASSSSNGSCGGSTLTVDIPNPPADQTDWTFSYTIQIDGGAYEAEHTVSCSRQ